MDFKKIYESTLRESSGLHLVASSDSNDIYWFGDQWVTDESLDFEEPEDLPVIYEVRDIISALNQFIAEDDTGADYNWDIPQIAQEVFDTGSATCEINYDEDADYEGYDITFKLC